MRAGETLGAMTFTGIFVPGLNRRTYLANPQCRVETFFVTPELKAAGEAVRFLPLCYGDILARLRSVPIDAALFMATPPDAGGLCSFGPVVDFLAEIWPRIPVRVAHLNPRLPRVASSCAIPFDATDGLRRGGAGRCSGSAEERGRRAVAMRSARRSRRFVPNGATIQTGLGKIPNAVLRALRGRRNLKVHSGLIPEAVCDLEDAGALAPGVAVTGGVAIGSQRLYDRVGGASYRFEPVSHTHRSATWAQVETPIALNSALEVDLVRSGLRRIRARTG